MHAHISMILNNSLSSPQKFWHHLRGEFLFKVQFISKLSSFSLLAVLTVGLTGCSTAKYYSHAAVGHLQLTAGQAPIHELIQDQKVEKKLKRQLQLVIELREFAETKLNLEVGKAYSKYKQLDRSAAVWVVYAAPAFSLELKSWNYPIIGEYQSKGFFKKAMAMDYAGGLKEKGFDVYLGEATAYSTLGWFNDPLLSTFLEDNDEQLAEVLFHELTHRTYYLKGDTMFNESFATAFARQGVQLWLKEKGEFQKLTKYQDTIKREDEFRGVLQQAKSKLGIIYKNADDTPEDILQKRKQQFIQSFKTSCLNLRKKWNSKNALKGWIEGDVNNAKLGASSVYLSKVPYFTELWMESGEDPKKYLELIRNLNNP